MKKLILSLALASAMGFYVNPAMSQASVDPGDGCEPTYGGVCCQWLDDCEHPWAGLVAEAIWVSDECFCI
jgi:hypothetical protein